MEKGGYYEVNDKRLKVNDDGKWKGRRHKRSLAPTSTCSELVSEEGGTEL